MFVVRCVSSLVSRVIMFMTAAARGTLRTLLLLSSLAGLSALVVSPAPRGLGAPRLAKSAARIAPIVQEVAPPPTQLYPLHDEAAGGDANAVGLLLLSGVPCDARNAYGSTPLHLAVLKGHGEVANLLLDHGAPVNAANEDGNTPLHAAVGAGQLACAELLLARGASTDASSSAGVRPLHAAAQAGNGAMVSALIDAGAEMSDDVAQAAFCSAVQLCEAVPEGGGLSADVPRLLRHVFEADHRNLLNRERIATNVTCMQPADDAPKTRPEHDPGYGVVDDDLLAVPLKPGRACAGGTCCDACSRVVFPTFASIAESEAFLTELQLAIVPPFHQFSLQKCAFRDMRTTLFFVRFVERMRRTIAHEYGLKLSTVAPLQTFVSFFMGEQDKQGGVHSDESTFDEFHYSCVLYLSTQHEDFEGGTFAFSDPPKQSGGERVLSPLSPSRGSAVIFSSGWENIHVVEPLRSGTRLAIPSFFTTVTRTEPSEATDGPVHDVTIADELWRNLIAPEEGGDGPRQFMMRWHDLLAPGQP